MATKELKTRISLRYDSYAQWTAKNPVLNKGEVAVATVLLDDQQTGIIPAGGADAGLNTSKPTVLLKVGDGVSQYNALPFITARAGDVYDWAKAANKPAYTAAEITNGTNTVAADITALNAAITELQGLIDSITDGGDGLSLAGLQEAIAAIEADITALNADENTTGSVANTVKTAVDAEATRINAIVGTPDTGKTIQAEIDAVEANIAEVQEAIETLNGADTVTGSVAKTVKDAIAAQKILDDADYADIEYETKVDKLIGTDTNKSVRDIANEELAAALIPENATEALDTLEEIAAWIQAHPDDAATMNAAITALQNKLTGIDTTVTAYVDDAIDDAIDALELTDTYATKTEVNTLAGRVTTAESDIDALETGATALEGRVETAESDIDALETSVTALEGRVETAEGDIDDLEGRMTTAESGITNLTNSLATVATTGKATDLILGDDDYLIIGGGDASTWSTAD